MKHVNVLILQEGEEVFKRTMKLLAAITTGTDIVHKEWVTESEKAGVFLDANEFIPRNAKSEQAWGFTIKSSLAKARALRTNGGLFANRTFYVSYKNGAELPQGNDIKDLISASGGEVVGKQKDLLNLPHMKRGVIIKASREEEIKSASLKKAIEKGCRVISIVDCLLALIQQELPKSLEVLPTQKQAEPPTPSMSKVLENVMKVDKLSPLKRTAAAATNKCPAPATPVASEPADVLSPASMTKHVQQKSSKDLVVSPPLKQATDVQAGNLKTPSKSKSMTKVFNKLSPLQSKLRTPKIKSPAAASATNDTSQFKSETVSPLCSTKHSPKPTEHVVETPLSRNIVIAPTSAVVQPPLSFPLGNNIQILYEVKLKTPPQRSTSIKGFYKELGQGGTVFIVKCRETDTVKVRYAQNGGYTTFQAAVPATDSEIARKIKPYHGGTKPAFYWDADNEAHEAGGTTIRGPMTPGKAKIGHRRFYFFFEDAVNLTIFLYELFSRRTFLVSTFFKPKSMFSIDEEPELPHKLLPHVDDMEMEGDEKASDDEKKCDDEEYDYHAESQAMW
jgi:hypothetical protein